MLKFKRISWRNFLSTGQAPTTIDLDAAHTTLITGENGAGKSTLLDAVCFGLYGKPYRPINLPQLVNSINEKECMVEVELEVGEDSYRIRRGIAPRVFEVFKNGELVDQDSTSRDYQKSFEETVLRMSYKAFCQVVILGSANYIPFMRLSAADRRAVVEAILDISIFTNMNILLKARVSKLKEDMVEVDAAITLAKQRIALQEKYIKDREKDSMDAVAAHRAVVEEKAKAVEEAEEEARGIRSRIDEMLSAAEEGETAQKEITDLKGIHSALGNKTKSLDKDIAFFTENANCPTCKQAIDEEFRTSKVEARTKKRAEVVDAVAQVEAKIRSLQSVVERVSAIARECRDLERQASTKDAEAKEARDTIRKAENSIAAIEKRWRDSEGKEGAKELEAMQGELSASQDRKQVFTDDQFHYGIAATMLKDGGIKSKIIKQYVPMINRTINRYLSQMNLFVNFTLDEEFNESIRSRHRDDFTYGSFSEGEKKKIDLALLFAWRHIASTKNSVSTNILIMDEILDGSMDDSAVEAFLEILKGFDRAVRVFVISHKPKELLDGKFERHISVVKKNNFSRQS